VTFITSGADGLGFALGGRLTGDGALGTVFDYADEKLDGVHAAFRPKVDKNENRDHD
jgi:NAD(P)-dependent dehydrogenase (short-subunit alcohol dehydrogenase family)